MALEVTGLLVEIGETVQVNEKFIVRSLVLELEDATGKGYKNYASLQTVQDKCKLLDNYRLGDKLTVAFNIKGRMVEKNGKNAYYTNLEAWKIVQVGQPAYVAPNRNEGHEIENWAKAANPPKDGGRFQTSTMPEPTMEDGSQMPF